MIDGEDLAKGSHAASLSREINKRCLPLFIGPDYVADSSRVTNPSATATLIKFAGRLYVVTCDHVWQQAYSEPTFTASLAVGRLVIQLRSFDRGGRRIPAIRRVNLSHLPDDIAIGEIPMEYLGLLSRSKEKSPIDLDDFVEPDWTAITFCLAAGFPDRMKSLHSDGTTLQSPMIEVIAMLNEPPKPEDRRFVLFSSLDHPVPHPLSGISGGPIFAINDQGAATPIGLVFEGHPSGEGSGTGEQSFLSENDILIRGLRLTPADFERWLDARD